MVQAFYKRVKVDELIGPMYPEGQWEQSEWRLREFLNYRLGGVTRYIEERGHPRLRARHLYRFVAKDLFVYSWLERYPNRRNRLGIHNERLL